MPASEKFYDSLKERLRNTKDRDTQDKLLDLWNETTTLATDYDAKLWGFDPDKWMFEERYMIGQQGKVPRTVRKSRPEQ